MSKRHEGIDEFKIARAFAAVAVMVALYGISLSAVALINGAPDTVAGPKSFWAPRNTAARASQREARASGPSGTSFWAANSSSTSSSAGLRLAGDVGQAARDF
jgi:hypothetical protein